MSTHSPPRPDGREARGGFVDFDNVQGVIASVRRGDQTSVRRLLAIAVLVLALFFAGAYLAGLLMDRFGGWEEFAAGEVEGTAWTAEARAAGDQVELRVRVDGHSAASPVAQTGPGASVRPVWLVAGEHNFVAGRAAAHVAHVRVAGSDADLARAGEASVPVLPTQGRQWLFVLPAGGLEVTTVEVEALDPDGEVLGTWSVAPSD